MKEEGGGERGEKRNNLVILNTKDIPGPSLRVHHGRKRRGILSFITMVTDYITCKRADGRPHPITKGTTPPSVDTYPHPYDPKSNDLLVRVLLSFPLYLVLLCIIVPHSLAYLHVHDGRTSELVCDVLQLKELILILKSRTLLGYHGNNVLKFNDIAHTCTVPRPTCTQ